MLFLTLLALQIGVPIVQLGAPGPARFGWQMFSKGVAMPTFEVHVRDGGIERVRVSGILTVPRQEIDFAAEVPPAVCGRRPDAEEVVTRSPRRFGEVVRYRCP